MNQGQEQFLGFILKKVASDSHGKVKELLSDSFKKQNDGKFGLEDLEKMAPKLHELIKPEHLDEVKDAMTHFASSLNKK